MEGSCLGQNNDFVGCNHKQETLSYIHATCPSPWDWEGRPLVVRETVGARSRTLCVLCEAGGEDCSYYPNRHDSSICCGAHSYIHSSLVDRLVVGG